MAPLSETPRSMSVYLDANVGRQMIGRLLLLLLLLLLFFHCSDLKNIYLFCVSVLCNSVVHVLLHGAVGTDCEWGCVSAVQLVLVSQARLPPQEESTQPAYTQQHSGLQWSMSTHGTVVWSGLHLGLVYTWVWVTLGSWCWATH